MTSFLPHRAMIRRFLCAFALLPAFALLAGCGGGETDAPSTSGSDETVSGGPTGGTLVVMADREPDQLNPITFNTTPAYQAVHLMFRALAQRDSTLRGYTPDLATSWAFEDDSTLVLNLRDDVYWHDGVKTTADDVVFTIERQRDAVVGSPRQGDVVAVSNAVARDSFTVAVTLSQTGPYTVNALLEVVPAPAHLLRDVAPAELRNAPFNRNPVGNGFYRFRSWQPAQSLTLEVNRERPEGRASLDRVIMRFTPDVSSAVTQLLSGHGDLIAKLPPDQYRAMQQAPGVQLHTGPRLRPAWLAWNTRRAPLDDVRVRRALLMGIDREAIARGLFGEIGEPAWSPIPAAMPEHSPDVTPIPFDTARARALLAEAGFRDTDRDGILDRNGQPLRIEVDYISSDAIRRDVLIAIQSMLRSIGVDIAPRAYESSTWVQRLRDGAFTGSFWGWGWGPGVAGPNARMVFHSAYAPPNGPNFAGSGSPRMDALLEQVLVTRDSAQARTLWRELEQLMIDDAVYAPVYMDPELYAVHARFRNVVFRGIEWNEDVPYWWVAPDARLPRDR